MIYFVCIFLLVFLSWRYDKRTSEKPGLAEGNDQGTSGNIYFLLYIAFVLLMGLSRALGGDKQVYIENFENIPRLQDGRDTMLMGFVLNLASGIMPLWTFLSILVKSVWPQDFTLFQLIHAAFVNYAVFWFFRKYTNCKYLCLLLYFGYRFFHFNCETMRESIAIALFLFAFPHLQKKNWKVYYALAIPALGFHVSAIMMVILPLIPRVRFTVKSFIRLSILCLALYLSVNVVMVPLISIVQGSLIASRYTAYIMGTGNFNGFVGNYLIYMLLPAAATYHMYLAKPRQQDWQELVIEKYFISSTFLTALITFNRFFEYFSVLAIAMFATYMMEFSLEKSRRILIAWCVGILVVFNMIKFFVIPAGQKPRYAMYYPYTTVFDDIPTSYRIDMHDAVTKVDYSEQRE